MSILEISEARDLCAILDAIRDGPLAWSTAVEIGEAVGTEGVQDGLLWLIDAGLVEAWLQCRPVAFTLTPLAAEGLGVELRERGLAGRLYWAEKRKRKKRDLKRMVLAPSDPALELVDPSPGPAELAIVAEEARRWKPRGAFSVDALPKPTRLLYDDGNPWHEFAVEADVRCGVCKDRPLALTEFCLSCRRWGYDGIVAKKRRQAARAKALQAKQRATA